MLSTAWAIWLAWTLPGLLGFFYGQPSAVLWKSQLFVAINERSYSPGALYRGELRSDRGIDKPAEYANPIMARFADQPQLEIRDDRVLLATPGKGFHIFPLADVPGLEESEFGERFRRLRGYRSLSHMFRASIGGDGGHQLLFPSHRAPDVPALHVEVAGELARTPESIRGWQKKLYAQEARFSVELVGPKSVRVFHAYKDQLFVSVELDYLANWYLDDEGRVSKDLPKPPERELRTGNLPADFTEYFCVYRAAGCNYFVTPNGKVYMAVPKGKAEVDVSAVWTDPNRPIAGVVQDLASDAIYGWGFVTNNRAPERFYVKMEPKPVAVPYKRTVPLWSDRSDAYLESYECARAFRKPAEKR